MSVTITPIEMGISVAYLLQGDRPVLVDAGVPGQEGKLRSALAERGVELKDLALVVLTHGHTDHTGTLPMLAASGVPIAVGRGDESLVETGRNGALPATGLIGLALLPFVRRMTVDPVRPDVIVEDRLDLREYGIDAEAELVGGHTPGSMNVRVGDQVLVGDLVRTTNVIRRGAPARHFYMEDAAGARRALESALGGGTRRLLPGHGMAMDAEIVRSRLDQVAPVR